MKKNIIIITPIKHINKLYNEFLKNFNVNYKPEITYSELFEVIIKYDVIFTNPNKSKIYLDKKILRRAKNLKIISTASTGTNHIDEDEAFKLKIKILSLKKEKNYMQKISSTAELAFTLMLSLVRNIIPARKSVILNKWDYYPFIGRQLNSLSVGVVGYGRLGKMFLNFSKVFGSKLFAYDPYKKITNKKINQCKTLKELFKNSDVVSLHLHVNDKTKKLINSKNLKYLKNGAILINTSRGEIIDENHLIKYLATNKESKYGTDVLNNEIRGIKNNILVKKQKIDLFKDRILITPHIGGMTKEAQEMAYTYSFKKLIKHIEKFYV